MDKSINKSINQCKNIPSCPFIRPSMLGFNPPGRFGRCQPDGRSELHGVNGFTLQILQQMEDEPWRSQKGWISDIGRIIGRIMKLYWDNTGDNNEHIIIMMGYILVI